MEFDSAERMAAAIADDVEAWRTDVGRIVLRDKKAGDKKPEDAKRVDVHVGLAFPDDFLAKTAAGKKTTVTLYADAAVTAVLVTPARLGDFLLAKTIYGTLLAGSQALVLIVIIRALTPDNWSVLLATVLLGSIMFTGIAMVTGSAGKDFIGTLFYSMLFLLPLMVPAFGVLFPGTAAAWVQAMPSYPILRTLHEVTTFGAGWNEVGGYLGVMAVWVVAIYAAGLLVLRRKVASL